MTNRTMASAFQSGPVDPTALTQDVLGHIYEMRTNALEGYYLGRSLGRAGKRLKDDLRHEIGFIQRNLQANVILNVLQFMEPSSRYVQNTLSYAVAAMPDDPVAWKGLHHAQRVFRLRSPTVKAVRQLLEGRIARRRNSQTYDALKIIRDKILAHSERFDRAIMKPVTWNQILSLLKFHDKMQSLIYLVCCGSSFHVSSWPTHTGNPLAAVLKKHGSKSSLRRRSAIG